LLACFLRVCELPAGSLLTPWLLLLQLLLLHEKQYWHLLLIFCQEQTAVLQSVQIVMCLTEQNRMQSAN
jgi:hypothetical protein